METNASRMMNLNRYNYQLWKTRMEDLLYAKGFHEPVFENKKPGDKTDEEWTLLHRQVCGYIRQWVDDDVLNEVRGEVDARNLWSKLEQVCTRKRVNRKLFMIKQLMDLRYYDGTPMSNHLNVFQGIVDQLSEMGIEFNEEVRGLLLLGTLPDSWETFKTSFMNSAVDGVISIELAKYSVLNEEMRRENRRLKDENRKLKDENSKFLENEVRLKEEQEWNEKAGAHLFTTIKVTRDDNLHEQIGKNIFFDLVDHDKVCSFRIRKETSFAIFKEEVAKEFGIPVQYQRFWLWAKRQNHTYRPSRPLTLEETHSVGRFREVAVNAELKLFLEVELGRDSQPVFPPAKSKEEILIFFKLYDPFKEELRYVGRLFVKLTGKPTDILTKLNELAGFAPDEELELFEEIKFKPTVMCEHVDKELTFQASQFEDGDIVCFQKPLQTGTVKCRYPDVPSFLDYVNNRRVVRFRSLVKPKEDEFSLELSKLNNYDDVVAGVASHLSLDDPSKIRLTSHNCYSQQPKPQPITYRGLEHLSDMLVHNHKTSDILYYEVLDISLPELQCLKTLKVSFHHATKGEEVIHTIRLPKENTVGDLINDLKTRVELSHEDAKLRMLEIFYHKIYRIFSLNEKIEHINDQYWTLRVEEIPEEEKDLSPQDHLIHVYHFMKEASQNQVQVQNFGEPFILVIRESETLASVKVRIQKKLQVPYEEYSQWRFAIISLGHPTYLQSSDVLSCFFKRRDLVGAWEIYLGLEHSEDASKRPYPANQNQHTSEK